MTHEIFLRKFAPIENNYCVKFERKKKNRNIANKNSQSKSYNHTFFPNSLKIYSIISCFFFLEQRKKFPWSDEKWKMCKEWMGRLFFMLHYSQLYAKMNLIFFSFHKNTQNMNKEFFGASEHQTFHSFQANQKKKADRIVT